MTLLMDNSISKKQPEMLNRSRCTLEIDIQTLMIQYWKCGQDVEFCAILPKK